MIRVLIADDHAIVREGLKQIVAEVPDMAVAGEAADGDEVLERVAEQDYDVVLLDISMPGKSALDVLKELRRGKPEMPVLILSIHPEEQYAVRFLRAGAAGYIQKEAAPDELVTAVRKVSQGRKYVSPALAETLAAALETDIGKPRHETLSDREYQVMCMIGQGKTVTEIAKELSLNVRTVSTYRSRVLKKMNMKTSAQLTRYVIENELIC